MPLGIEILIAVWMAVGFATWLYMILTKGEMTVGDLVMIIGCIAVGPIILFLLLDQTVLWKRKL